MKVTKKLIAEIKSKNDLLLLVKEFVTLNDKGWGLCPFHKEKTASFHVHHTGKFWYCFGCGRGGDVIEFVKWIKRISFIDAIKFLAQRSGISLTINN